MKMGKKMGRKTSHEQKHCTEDMFFFLQLIPKEGGRTKERDIR